MSIDPSSSTPLPASIEAGEYSGWDEADPEEQERAKTRLVAGAEALGDRLDKWLATRLDQYSRAPLQQWISDGYVLVNGAPATIRQRVWERDEVVVMPQPSPDELAFAAEDVPFAIVHEDDAILVVDKRAGLVVHPGSGNWSGTLLNGLLHHDPSLSRVPRAGIVHRLDKDTSGLMVVAKTLEAQTDLVRQLQARSVARRSRPIGNSIRPLGGTRAIDCGWRPSRPTTPRLT
jgi:23S rRNA pseudouridine1911/1915/1917 synthase